MTPTSPRPRPAPATFRRRAVALVGALALSGLTTAGLAAPADATPVLPSAPTRPSAPLAAPTTPDLGPNVTLITPAMAQADVQAKLDAIAARQVPNQFGEERDAILFAPGTYGSAATPLIFQVGYYTEVAGLGRNPGDVVINGAVNVYNQCEKAADGTESCIALNNFWRSMSNLTINPTGGKDCRANTEFWAVSQAAPLRRVDITGLTSLMDYCSAPPQYASGGYLADARTKAVTNGSQQQWLTRNSEIGSWSNGVWNQTFSGVEGAPAQGFPDPPYTTLAQTPASKEKPYVYIDARGAWQVFVPKAQKNSSGPTWTDGPTPGKSLPLSTFFVARPSDSAKTIEKQLSKGRNLLFTPGVYGIDRTLHVRKAGTVVLGLGIATLTAEKGAVPIRVSEVPDVDIAGITIDAGTKNSSALLVIGTGKGHGPTASRPTAVQDVFFRIGGPHVGKADTSLVVKSDHVILDDIWAWRADHGEGVGWKVNTADTGVKISGDDVTATGLFVEHYQRYNVIWTGERGRTVFFQNELPYDAPNQAAWKHGKTLGWAAYKVGDDVRKHELWAGGSYIYTNVDPTLHLSHSFEVPDRKGVRLHDLVTVSLNNAGTIDHVVNDTGDAATPKEGGSTIVDLVAYPVG
ncbi:adenylyl cyclase [Microlunatus antarcticus]|uniref:Adenylyl cyclase n=1 Tax=Microlunatus antarcticus TaxID=53388 RepID=A0A7W5P7T8_9ACTN|nr:adenylyl cyclase [Microlunatus antarcticus]MBB3327772.1 hypothetical protein [Microlunatus antarcticus]